MAKSKKAKGSLAEQHRYEREQMAWANGILNKTKQMTQKLRKSWAGEVKDAGTQKIKKGQKVK